MILQHIHRLSNKFMLDIQILQKAPFYQNVPLVLVSIHVR